jgi:pimeloyl-ACP methyl ester carboxylesterase
VLGSLYGLVSEHEKANECYQKGIASSDDDSVKERMQRKIRWKKIVENDGVKLAYYVCGKGEKTLFFLAWTGTDRLWIPQVNYFSKKYIVTMDLRGTGESDKPPGEYTVDLFMDDLRVIIEDLPDKKIIFVGLYIGGMVGIKYVTKYPGRISKLVLLSVGPKQIRSNDYPDGLVQRDRIEQFYVQALKSPSWGVKKLAEFFSQDLRINLSESDILLSQGLLLR